MRNLCRTGLLMPAGRCLAVIALVAATSVSAQIVGDPAGPRPGPVVVLDVVMGPDTVQELNDQGYSISNVRPGYVEVHATVDERDKLIADGYSVTEVEWQPSPPTFGPTTRAFGTFYHSYAMMTADLQAYEVAFPAICRLVTLGKSVQGRELWAMLITDNPDTEEAEPEFKYVSTMHGNEPVGTEMCLQLIDLLLNDYGVDGRITGLVDSTAIWIVPLMNPDGLELGQRNNANGFDLNRSFPKYPTDFTETYLDEWIVMLGYEPEVRRLVKWTRDNSFVLSANFHTGAVVASYPLDAEPGVADGQYAASADDALYIEMSNTYAATNPPMLANNILSFTNGITNGNEWFTVEGGMQDLMYRHAGGLEITVELAVPKTPAASLLPQYWAENEESMLSYLEWVHRGVRGVITDVDTGDPIHAKIAMSSDSQAVISDPDVGDYYRVLLPGTYDLTFSAIGYRKKTVQNIVVTPGAATQLDVQLEAVVAAPHRRWGQWVMGVALALLAVMTLAGHSFSRRSLSWGSFRAPRR